MLSMFPLSLLGIIKKLISSLKNSSRKAAKLKESKESFKEILKGRDCLNLLEIIRVSDLIGDSVQAVMS